MPSRRRAPSSPGRSARSTAAGVAWCLLRGETDLAASSGDVDLLVGSGSMADVPTALAAAGLCPLPSWGRGSHRFFVGYDERADAWVKLDVVSELAFGPFQDLPTAEGPVCLARRRQVGATTALAADDAFWALLLHCLLDRGEVAPHHGVRLGELAGGAGVDSPLARTAGAACPPGWDAARLLEVARRQDWPALEGLAGGMRRRWVARQPVRSRGRSLRNRVGRRMGKLQTLLERRGMAVALLGPDGAGKSTLAEGLRSSFYLPTRSLYAGLYGAGAGKVPKVPGLRLAVRLLKLWRLALAAEVHKARGRLVVFDRYTSDALLPGAGRRGVASRARRWLLAHACPTPSLIVVLDAPAQALFDRKGEHDVAKLEEQRQGYATLARLPRVVLVDAARPPEEVRRAVTSLVWQRWGRRGRR